MWADDGPKWPLGWRWQVAIGGLAGCLEPLSGLPQFLVPGRAGLRAWGSAKAGPEQRAGLARARVSSGRAGFVSGFFFVLRVMPSCLVLHGQVYFYHSLHI